MVAIAGVLAMQPEVLILMSHRWTGPHGRDEILEEIAELHRRGIDRYSGFYNMEDVARYASRVIGAPGWVALDGIPRRFSPDRGSPPDRPGSASGGCFDASPEGIGFPDKDILLLRKQV